MALRRWQDRVSAEPTRFHRLQARLLPVTIRSMNIPTWLRGGMRRAWRERVALLVLLAIGHAGYAFAAHAHPLDGESSSPPEICGICLHAERLGATPDVPIAAAITASATPYADVALPELASAPRHAYRSRAPPRLTP